MSISRNVGVWRITWLDYFLGRFNRSARESSKKVLVKNPLLPGSFASRRTEEHVKGMMVALEPCLEEMGFKLYRSD